MVFVLELLVFSWGFFHRHGFGNLRFLLHCFISLSLHEKWLSLVLSELNWVDASFFAENSCVNHIVYQSFLFEKLLVIQEIMRGKESLEKTSAFKFIFGVF